MDVNAITDRCMHVEHVAQRYCCFLALIRSPSSSLRIDVTVEVIFHLTLIVSIPFIYLFFLPPLYDRHYILSHLILTPTPELGEHTLFIEGGGETPGGKAYSLKSRSL